VPQIFDGYIAREFNQITVMGQILDPLADKMLTLAGFLGLMIPDVASPWAIIILSLNQRKNLFYYQGLKEGYSWQIILERG